MKIQNETPEQRAARIEQTMEASAKRTREVESRRKIGGFLVRKNKLHVTHMPRSVDYDGFSTSGGSVAFRAVPHPSGALPCFYEVATAFQHPNDQFLKSEGRYYAASRFDAGQRITIRIPEEYRGRVDEYLPFLLLG